jgi:type I restriction-modification system DNA methylase subunit
MSHNIADELLNDIQTIREESPWQIIKDLTEHSALKIQSLYKKDNQEMERIQAKYQKYNAWEKVEAIECKMWEMLAAQTEGIIPYGDYLGELYMKSETSNSKAGQFFTPFHVSQLLAQLQQAAALQAQHDEEIITLNDPTCGSGGLLIAVIEMLAKQGVNTAKDVLIECSDIDERCVNMAYVQLSLLGVPARVIHQDVLTQTTWKVLDTPALVMQWLRFARKLKRRKK